MGALKTSFSEQATAAMVGSVGIYLTFDGLAHGLPNLAAIGLCGMIGFARMAFAGDMKRNAGVGVVALVAAWAGINHANGVFEMAQAEAQKAKDEQIQFEFEPIFKNDGVLYPAPLPKLK